jgi:hypothetical protein
MGLYSESSHLPLMFLKKFAPAGDCSHCRRDAHNLKRIGLPARVVAFFAMFGEIQTSIFDFFAHT